MLTNAAVKAARPRAAAYKLPDARGLYLHVTPNNPRSWRWRFRWGGKEQTLTIGDGHQLALADARDRADQARALLARGDDPRNLHRGDANLHGGPDTFETIGRRWHALMVPRWTPVHASDVLASLERDVFPAIGAMPIRAITTPVVLEALRSIEGRANRPLETVRRIRQRMSAIFVLAIAEGLHDQDPAAVVGRALIPPPPAKHHPALLEIQEARALLAAAELVDTSPVVKSASRFLALTAVRLAALRGARWDQIEDLDGPAPVWRVPAALMKLAAVKKLDAKNDHFVPLSRQAAELLRAVRATHQNQIATDLIFAVAGGAIGEAAIGDLYKRAGYEGRHVPHGWRASFSTILNESRPDARGQIDRALGHVAGKRDKEEEGINRKVEGAYNRSKLLGPRRELFQAWADQLMGI